MKFKKSALLVSAILLFCNFQPASALNLGSSLDGQTITQEIGQQGRFTFTSEDYYTSTVGAISASVTSIPANICNQYVLQEAAPFKDRWTLFITGTAEGSCKVMVKDNSPYAKKKPSATFTLQIVKAKDAISVAYGKPTLTSPSLRLITGGEIAVSIKSGNKVLASSVSPNVCSVLNPSTDSLVFSLKAYSLGTCQIKFESAGNLKWAPAALVATVTVQKATQTISYSALPFWYVSMATAQSPVKASSGLPVTVSTFPSTVCLWSNNVLTFFASGTCYMSMSQAGDETYLPVSANWSFEVKKMDKAIVVGSPLKDMTVGTNQTLNITGSKLLTLTSLTPAVCSLNGLVVSALKVGACSIYAVDPSDKAFNAAPEKTLSFAVTLVPATITYSGVKSSVVGSSGLVASFNSNSPAQISVKVADPSICTYTAGKLNAIKAGTCVLSAEQTSTGNFSPASPLKISIPVLKNQNSLVAPIAAGTLTLDKTLSVNLSTQSGVTASISIQTGSNCAVAGSVITPLAAGNCVLNISTPESENYLALATQVKLTISKAQQTISASTTSGSLSLSKNKVTTVTAKSSSGLPVTLTSNAFCSVVNGVVTALKATTASGTCQIYLSQAGNGVYQSVTGAPIKITINP